MPSTHIPEGDYLTKTQIAEQRKVSPIAVQKWIERGELPALKIPSLGYIVNARDLEHFQPHPVGWKKGRPRKPKSK